MLHDLLLHEHRDVINWSRGGARHADRGQVHSGVASVNVRQDALDEACVAHLHTDTDTQTHADTQTDRHRHTDTERHRDTHARTHSETHRHTHYLLAGYCTTTSSYCTRSDVPCMITNRPTPQSLPLLPRLQCHNGPGQLLPVPPQQARLLRPAHHRRRRQRVKRSKDPIRDGQQRLGLKNDPVLLLGGSVGFGGCDAIAK